MLDVFIKMDICKETTQFFKRLDAEAFVSRTQQKGFFLLISSMNRFRTFSKNFYGPWNEKRHEWMRKRRTWLLKPKWEAENTKNIYNS
jgi:hypothetical protein